MSKSVAVVYDYITRAIEAGGLSAGQPIREEIIAAQVAVSRTPVREAFRILTGEGWLEARTNQGVCVTAWDQKHIEEIFDVRILIEPELARLATPRITASDIAELTSLAETMVCDGHPTPEAVTRMQQANDRFHSLLIGRANHETLASLLNSVRKIPLVKKTFDAYSEHERSRSNFQHFEIISAMRDGDAELAHAIMKSHILYGRATALRALTTHSNKAV